MSGAMAEAMVRALTDGENRAVSVLGTGTMGRPIALRLAAEGFAVRVWNRTADRGRMDEERRIESCASPAEAVAGIDQVLVVLADDRAVEEVFFGAAELARHLVPGQTVLNLGTVSPAAVEHLGERLAPAGIEVLDVGMLGNARHARDGELRLYVGGRERAITPRVSAILDVLGKEVSHLGPLGSGMKLKLALNLLMGLEMQALAEVGRFGELLGLDRSVVLEAVGGSGFSAPVMTFKSRRMIRRDYERPDFRLALMAKDLRLADELAMRLGIALPMTGAANDAHRDACDAGWSELDCAAIADALTGQPVNGS